MEKIRFKLAAAILVILFLITSTPNTASAAVVKRSLTPQRVFQFAPPVQDQIIQTFDNGAGADVYFAQQVGSDTRLSRCSRTATGICAQRDSVILPGYGHGESLEVYTEKGRTYAWVGSKAVQATVYKFASEVSLIEYIKARAGSKLAKYRVVGTLTNLAAVAPGKTGAGIRSNVAIADGSDRLALRVQVDSAASSSYYAIYKTAALTALMKKAPGKKLSIVKAKSLMVSQFKEPARPHNSFQGFDIKGVGTNKKFLYVFGGQPGQAPTIYRFAYANGGKVKQDRTYVIKGAYVASLEAEGIKVEADPTNGGKVRIQHSLNPTGRDKAGRKMFRLYSFAE
ncbi:hypothetical protein [Paeniglutamicibacter sp. NPDC091659]|uniref:hypothetical protein n=1 Tax=Paeniglutamicibacter sp. NPDC091659 TaxID=3364389 RepID=UPI0038164011